MVDVASGFSRTFFMRMARPAKAGRYVPLVIAIVAFLATAAIAAAAETPVRSPGEGGTLVDAAEQGDRAAALRLLAKGANPNLAGPDGTTAVMWAASNDDLELVRALIKAGANVKTKNQFGTSALTEAAVIGSAPIPTPGTLRVKRR